MKSWKKHLVLVLALLAICVFTLTACAESKPRVTVKIGVVGEAQEMWVPITEALAKEGIDIKLISFTDYATPNRALNDGETDLNAFQHYAFLRKEIANNGYKLVSIGDTFISAMCIYSYKIKDVADVKDGDTVAVPNDATNEGRALKILEAAGIIKLDPAAGDTPEVTDITEYVKKVKLVEVDAGYVCSVLPDVTIGVVNCNYALDFGFNPGKDSIFYDSVSIYSGDTFVNLIACREGDQDNEVYKRIVEAYQTEEVKAVFADAFKGSYIAGWEK